MDDRQMTMVIVTRIWQRWRQPTTIWTYHAVWLVVQMHSSLNDSTSQRRNVSTNVATMQRVVSTNVSTSQRCNVSTCECVNVSQRTSQCLNDATCKCVNVSTCLNERLNDATCQRVNVSTNVSTSQQRSCGVSCSLVTTSFSCGLDAELLLLNSTYHAVSINTTVGCHTLVTLSRRTVSHTRIVCVTHWDCVRVAGQPWRVEFSAVTVGTVMLLLVSPGETNSSEKEHSRWYRWSEVGWG